ncbi:hypothetical protein AU210_016390 [Fusarium oxysporum f. sp. radicis-cucumerinum]|uniref:Uncharacterized protein n=1 Tax=Fusarium oxysporum f. sp. radicis-cucumerinum TaxID=327505 RepID=A0A2H3FP81_FUSOX|nr:hypothetical protein AU210_016390 [Fusarium oxysporum f. sp. radicis-cucumerinum]
MNQPRRPICMDDSQTCIRLAARIGNMRTLLPNRTYLYLPALLSPRCRRNHFSISPYLTNNHYNQQGSKSLSFKHPSLYKTMDLEDAEISAGVRTLAIRDKDSNIIDICIIDTSTKSSSYDEALAEALREKTQSKSLSLDCSYGGTLVALNFDEAHLSSKVFKALREYGFSPSYKPV